MSDHNPLNDTVRMVPLTPVALGGSPRRVGGSRPQSRSMEARLQRALERIMDRLTPGASDSR